MPSSALAFESFYVGYRAQHAHRMNRAMHLLAKLLTLGALAFAVSSRSILALIAVPILFVAPCWLGHLLFERNRPTSWDDPASSILGTLTRPLRTGESESSNRWYYSVLADFRMCAELLGVVRAGAANERM